MQKYFSIIWRLWKLLKPFHKIFYIQLILISVLGAMEIYESVMLSKIINAASGKNTDDIFKSFILFFIFIAAYWTFDFIKDYKYAIDFSRNVYQHLREFSLRQVLRLNIAQFQDTNSSIKWDTVSRGEERLVMLIENLIINIIPSIAIFSAALFTLLSYNIYIVAITVVGCALIFYFETKHNSRLLPLMAVTRDRNLIQNKITLEAFQHLSSIKMLSIENKFTKDYLQKREENMQENLSLDKQRESYYGKRNYLMAGLSLLNIFVAIYLLMHGNLLLGSIFAVFSISEKVFNQARRLQLNLSRLTYNYIDTEKYLDLMDLQPEFDEHGKEPFKSGDIEIKNLSFKYPKSEGLVLDDINLIIKEGTRVAFVGHSGSGKTTITKLLMRAYDYTQTSSILIAGTELRDIGSHDLRSHIGYVEQHVDLFDNTVRENILMGVDEKTLNKWSKQKVEIESINMLEYKLEEVAKLSRIDEFYHRLGDDKFDTEIGERGIKLSGGERQRVGIARAIIKDPAILIFDEATSALDTVNEKYIKEAIDNVSRGRTTIIIAHRLSTVQDADMIIVMDRGEIVATGTHNDLLSSSTHYQELIQAQLK